jgi:hypothetical protein
VTAVKFTYEQCLNAIKKVTGKVPGASFATNWI